LAFQAERLFFLIIMLIFAIAIEKISIIKNNFTLPSGMGQKRKL
jgi:hypothetical protein